MKISIIGAGNVGGLAAMRIAECGLGDVFLIDIAQGIACGKAMDIADSRGVGLFSCRVQGSEQMQELAGSDIAVIIAGFPRKPGMTREDLINKNAEVVRGLCLTVKESAPQAILIIVTNPLDLMTQLALKVTGFNPRRIIGMGVSLDASRFANLIAEELGVLPQEVDACVIGSHGEGMMPLAHLTTVGGVSLSSLLDKEKQAGLIKRTIGRGMEIVTCLGSGSAYFAPSAAIASLVKAIARDEKRIIGASAWLNGEYGVNDVCMGTPCRIGRAGIEQVIELELQKEEKEAFAIFAQRLKEQFKNIQ
jgi:malate dehydrogenase